MTIKIKIGAPSLTGKGAKDDVNTAIAGMDFPCSLLVTNHMPRAAVFPESGVELASTFAETGRSAVVPFATAGALTRLVRSATQIADLNGFALALVISDGPEQAPAEESPALADEGEAAPATPADTSISAPEVADAAAVAERNTDGGDSAAVAPNPNSDGDTATGDNGGAAGEQPAPQTVKRGRGRPPGSKSKPK